MITFKNGKSISSVVVSTIAGHYGNGMLPYVFDANYNTLLVGLAQSETTIMSKSATFNKRVGNVVMHKPWTALQYIKRIDNRGMVNAYGLTNPGARKCAEGIAKSIKNGYDVIPNFYPEFARDDKTSANEQLASAIHETLEAIRFYECALGTDFRAIEINLSCPNSKEKIAENMFQSTELLAEVKRLNPHTAVIAKVSWVHPIEFLEEIANQKLADALHCFNTVPYELVFGAGKRSPLKNGLGGVSGGPIRELCFQKNKEVAKRVKLPIIMGGGVPVAPLDEVLRYFDIGAGAVSICTEVAYSPLDALTLIHSLNH